MPLHPLNTTNRIRSEYSNYLSSLLKVRDPAISRLAAAEVKGFVNGPFLEATPPFIAGKSLEDLCAEGVASSEFQRIAQDIHYSRTLYAHQETAVRKAARGKNIIVATGTGSGKTECYLLPIFNALMKSKQAGTLSSGVRALLLFPMNALANDQLKRLRELLKNYPEITFGRYTGETKQRYSDALTDYMERNDDMQPLPNELISREQMQEAPPHILLTNYAMLEYLLLRPDDSVFFDSSHASHWEFLVIDEAHTYKGATGTEIALLLQRLKERISHHSARRLQCFATSATLAGGTTPKAMGELASFATNLFGEPFYPQDIITSKRQVFVPSGDVHAFAPDEYKALSGHYPVVDENSNRQIYQRLLSDTRLAKLLSILEEKPAYMNDVAKQVFPDLPGSQQQETLAMLVELAARAKPSDTAAALFPARYHLFAKSLEGLFISLYPQKHVYLDRKEVTEAGAPVFELANCQRCGQEYIIGKTVENVLCQVAEDHGKKEYYLIGEDSLADVDEDDECVEEASNLTDQLEQYILCTACGHIVPAAAKQAVCCDNPTTVKLYKVAPKNGGEPNACASCGSVSPNILKRFLTANHAASFAILNSLYEMIPSKQYDDGYTDETGRKLLTFSDNRQEAAFFAGYTDRVYNQLLWRKLMLKVLRDFEHDEVTIEYFIKLLAKEAKQADIAQGEDYEVENIAGQYVMAELLRMEKNTGLEGRGYVAFKPKAFSLSQSLLGLTLEETKNLIRFVMDTIRFKGAVTFPGQVDAKDEFFEPRNHVISFKKESKGSASTISFLPSPKRNNLRSKLIKKLFDAGEDASSVLSQTYSWLTGAGKDYLSYNRKQSSYQLSHKKWVVHLIGEEETLFRCKSCGKVVSYHLRGICPEWRCKGSLEEVRAGEFRASDPYYKALYENEKLIPMVAKEHTAQLSSEAAGEYQKDFESGRINVLSCSTTFEMGVDVGELEATFLRNVPPETANYIQRAGRAGRRTSSAAFSITFARRNSHDLHFYRDPTQIISGKIKTPYIEVDNEKIAWRHVNSIVFAWFFHNHPEFFKGKTAALIGKATGKDARHVLEEDFAKRPRELIDAMRRVLPEDLFRRMKIEQWAFVENLIGAEGKLTAAIEQRSDEVRQLEQLRDTLYQANRPINAVDKQLKTYRDEQSINFLSSHGVLPKYGFPIDLVKLNIHSNDDAAGKIELTRDLRLAIGEYAPPSQVDANGKRWTSRYINMTPDKGLPGYWYYECTCKHSERTDVVAEFSTQDNKPENKPCPVCSKSMKARKYVSPIFGFSTSWEDKARAIGEARPLHGYTSKVQYWGIDKEKLDEHQKTVQQEQKIQFGTRTVSALYSPEGRLAVLNKGKTEKGLFLCPFCGYAFDTFKCPRTPKELAHKNKYGNDCSCKNPQQISLGHTLSTDILQIELPGLSGESDLFPGKHEASSVLYSVLNGASEELEITRSDIGGCVYNSNGKWLLILFDTAAGGAGHVKRVFEHIEDVLKRARGRVDSCGCSEETSCYGCLRDYGNQYVHEQLARGAAHQFLSGLLAYPGKNVSEASVVVTLRGGKQFSLLYSNWAHCARNWGCDEMSALGALDVVFPDLCAATLCVADEKIENCLVWSQHKIVITDGDEEEDLRQKATNVGWLCITADDLRAEDVAKRIGGQT